MRLDDFNVSSIKTANSTKLKKLVNGKRISIRDPNPNPNPKTSGRPNPENGTTFSEFPFVPGIFQWDEPKNVYHLHPNRNFREFVVNGKQPWF